MTSQLNLDVELDDAQSELEKSYDEYPYESKSFPSSHPDHLYVLGTLFGMKPADPGQCRVLELGCASGGNLIPMAAQLPESQFFGVDLSAAQIKSGQALIKSLKLKNIKLEKKDVLKVGGRIRKFDYIICHGVYSWVPEKVQEKILDVCSNYLNKNGIAYISYNTYPGWHMRESIRNMMRFHTAQFSEIQDKVNQSRALLNFLAQSNTQGDIFGQYLIQESQALANTSDSYIAHEHLEGINRPQYFYEFAQAAEKHELQYLAEAEVGTMLASNFPEQVSRTLQNVGKNVIQMEQYMDFLRNRMFRCTLLCHKDIGLKRTVEPSLLKDLHISSPIRPVSAQADIEGDGHVEFIGLGNIRIGSARPLTKHALTALGKAWPESLAFSELLENAASAVGLEPGQVEDPLAADVLQAYMAGAMQTSHRPVMVAAEISDKPMVSHLSREQAKLGNIVTNQRHQPVTLNEPLRQLLLLLDGKHTHGQLIDALESLIREGKLLLHSEGQPVSDANQIRSYTGQLFPRMMNELFANSLLIA